MDSLAARIALALIVSAAIAACPTWAPAEDFDLYFTEDQHDFALTLRKPDRLRMRCAPGVTVHVPVPMAQPAVYAPSGLISAEVIGCGFDGHNFEQPASVRAGVQQGIAIMGATEHIIIAENTVQRFGHQGIHVKGATRPIIQGNTVRFIGCSDRGHPNLRCPNLEAPTHAQPWSWISGYGIQCGPLTVHCMIVGNFISDVTKYGAAAYDVSRLGHDTWPHEQPNAPRHALIAYNRVERAMGSAVTANGTWYTTIQGNTVEAGGAEVPGQAGACVSTSPSNSGLKILDNRCLGADAHALRIEATDLETVIRPGTYRDACRAGWEKCVPIRIVGAELAVP